jgi:hypothetical protein
MANDIQPVATHEFNFFFVCNQIANLQRLGKDKKKKESDLNCLKKELNEKVK